MTTSRHGSPLSILIVDDWPDAAESMAEVLRLYGFDVALAHDAHEAMAEVRRRRPDVALLDLGLPRLDGCALAGQLLALPGERPLLIAVSGYGEARDRDRCKRAGFDHYFIKPLELGDLLAVLKRQDEHLAARREALLTRAGPKRTLAGPAVC